MLKPIAPELWCATHRFKSMGLALSSRMTVVRFPDHSLWLHSPIPLTDALKTALNALGRVRWIVAPTSLTTCSLGTPWRPTRTPSCGAHLV